MSHLNEIKEFVLCDVREGDPKYSKYVVEKDGWNDLETRLDIYKKKGFGPDAERWERALSSYKRYKVFSSCSISRSMSKTPILAYTLSSGKIINIPADLLTNPSPIVDKYNSLFDNKERLYPFLRVSYSPGNFCPVWYNLGNGTGNNRDTVWYKLDTYVANASEFTGLEDRKEDTYLLLTSRKCNCQIFDVLPHSTNDKNEIIKGLYFQDYFDNNSVKYVDIPGDKEEFLEYIKVTTRNIISRGYRIFTGKDILDTYDYDKINAICNEIGLF